jgi:hypothetical protein
MHMNLLDSDDDEEDGTDVLSSSVSYLSLLTLTAHLLVVA